jgi:hypothetical protein
MKNNPKSAITNITVCGLCGLIMTTTISGFICANPQCPEYMCERHDHLPEKGDTGASYYFDSNTSIGTPSPSAADDGEFPYLNNSQMRGGER